HRRCQLCTCFSKMIPSWPQFRLTWARMAAGLGSLWRRLSSRATFKLDYLSNEGFPHRLSPLDNMLDSLNARKVLFGHHKYLRYRSWLRKELAQYLRDSLASCRAVPFLNAEFVRGAAEEHIAGRRN